MATAKAVCELLKLDKSFCPFFKNTFYCRDCEKLVEKVKSNLKILHSVQESLARSSQTIQDLLRKTYEKLATYGRPPRKRRPSNSIKSIIEGLLTHSGKGMSKPTATRGRKKKAKDKKYRPPSPEPGPEPERNNTRPLRNRISKYSKDVLFPAESSSSSESESESEEEDQSEKDMDFDDSPDFEPSQFLKQEIMDSEPEAENESALPEPEHADTESEDEGSPDKVQEEPKPKTVTVIVSKPSLVKVKASEVSESDSSGRQRLYCPVDKCKFSCFTNTFLQVHIREKHDKLKEPFFCDMCPMKFSNATSYYYHRRRHTEEPTRSCPYCKKPFYEKWALKKHIDSVHATLAKIAKPKLTTPILRRVIFVRNTPAKKATKGNKQPDGRKRKTVASTSATGSAKKRIYCKKENCKFSCFKQLLLDTHVREKHEGNPTPFYCDLCPLKFSSSTSFHYHYRRHTAKPSQPCQYCPKLFYEKWAVKKHIEAVHIVQKRYRCDVCAFIFGADKEDDMKAHKVLHDEVSATSPYSCVLCEEGQGFTNYFDLRKHVGFAHGTQRSVRHDCPKCQRSFDNPKVLQRHITGLACERNPSLTCTNCKLYVAKTKSDLIKHLSSHEPGRDHMCEECGSTFKSYTALRLHKRIHTVSVYIYGEHIHTNN
jgi:KRAB domain-containing zinc finger protein